MFICTIFVVSKLPGLLSFGSFYFHKYLFLDNSKHVYNVFWPHSPPGPFLRPLPLPLDPFWTSSYNYSKLFCSWLYVHFANKVFIYMRWLALFPLACKKSTRFHQFLHLSTQIFPLVELSWYSRKIKILKRIKSWGRMQKIVAVLLSNVNKIPLVVGASI